jgi:hypothetical protein
MFIGASLQAAPDPSAPRCFQETGQCVEGRFREFWEQNGGLPVFGYPISEELMETLEDGRQYRVQYFERAVFEYHPENQPAFQVLLSQLGTFRLRAKGGGGGGGGTGGGGGSATVSVSLAGPRVITVSRRGRFVFRFRATPGSRGTAVFRSVRAIRVSARRRVTFARRSFRTPSSGRVTLRIRLSRRNFRILRRNRRVAVRVSVTATGPTGGRASRSRRLTLRAPRRRR